MGRATIISRADRAAALAGALVCALALGGCGGIEFKGKVFDAMGVSGDRQKEEVRMAERPPLLLPPNLKALPQPGTGASVATARQDWPEDPERARKRISNEEQAKKDKAEAEADPMNPFAGKPTLLDKLFGRRQESEPIDDVPEPDPADKTPADRARQGDAVASSGPKSLTPQTPQESPPAEDPFHPATPESYTPEGQQKLY